VNNTLTSYTYNIANNELRTSSTGSSSTVYSYDPDGNMLTKNVTSGGISHWTYAWDVTGRLVKVTNDAGVQGSYAYDARERLVGSKEESTTSFYAYLGTETLYQSIVGSSSTDYVFAGGNRIARITGTNVNYYHSDSLGSTRLVTTSSGSVSFADNYQPFGQDNGSPTGYETYKFTGKPWSAAIGLYYNYLRWYDPSIGRLISLDPLTGVFSIPQSLNRYVYAGNAPTLLTDPSGAAEEECGDKPCEGGKLPSGFWTIDDVQRYISRNGITNPKLIEQCEDNPMFCPTTLRWYGYDPFDTVGPGEYAEYFWEPETGVTPSPEPTIIEPSATVTTTDTPATTVAESEGTTIKWPANTQGMEDLLGEPGTSIPDRATTPGRGQMRWEIRSDPRMRIVGEQHPYDAMARPAKQAWHWHVEGPGRTWGIPGTPMPDWLVKILTYEGYL